MTPKQIADIEVFFANNIEADHFASRMRCFMRAAITYYMEDDDMQWKSEILDGYYLLTEFVELLDPVMDKCRK